MKEAELKETFDVIGSLEEIGKSICATMILYTGEVKAIICICSTFDMPMKTKMISVVGYRFKTME
jgi:hypothetical protein